jgi:hypothetical protein
VLANATELFTNIDQSMPKFSDWLQQSMGINSSATLEVGPAPPRPTTSPAAHPTLLCFQCSSARRRACAPFPLLLSKQPLPTDPPTPGSAAGVRPHLAAPALQHHQRLRRQRGVHHTLRLHLLPADHVRHAVFHRHVPGGALHMCAGGGGLGGVRARSGWPGSCLPHPCPASSTS